MRFLVDECSGSKVFEMLKEKGYDAKFVSEIMSGASDEEVLEFAEKENRILITNDKDFGELIFRLRMPSSGVILFRLNLDTSKQKIKYLSYLLENFQDKLQENFVVITEGQVRIRKI
ncbi:DUF5615 family PIN-like protein [Candidatus Pacearchaeota archaeon]|nr:DUF5615 family PIN-like protein [Candidatus Pacearchaeota archaeon]